MSICRLWTDAVFTSGVPSPLDDDLHRNTVIHFTLDIENLKIDWNMDRTWK